MTEAERVQPDINAKLNAVLRKLGTARGCNRMPQRL